APVRKGQVVYWSRPDQRATKPQQDSRRLRAPRLFARRRAPIEMEGTNDAFARSVRRGLPRPLHADAESAAAPRDHAGHRPPALARGWRPDRYGPRGRIAAP